MSERVFDIVGLVWFFGWGISLLRWPVTSSRVLAWGKQPTTKRLKMAKIVGYMGIVFGFVVLIELIVGLFQSK